MNDARLRRGLRNDEIRMSQTRRGGTKEAQNPNDEGWFSEGLGCPHSQLCIRNSQLPGVAGCDAGVQWAVLLFRFSGGGRMSA